MKPSTRLDSAFFQLTPTRTRCDLIITAHGKTEKIATGLLNPFLTHLRTAQDQIAKGGYSILLEPGTRTDATWFTKGTIERFVRFVSTPEILERVYSLESEILQIDEAIVIQGNTDFNTVENHQVKSVGSNEGNKSVTDANEEKALVLYKPGERPPQEMGPTTQEGNSKVQLLKVLETRKIVLQKEQGMAFARAVAAGFDIDNISPLISFAESFGAARLMDACLRFMDLWKLKLESGQWPEVEAAEVMSSRSDFSAMNASGIMLASVAEKHNESRTEVDLGNNAKAGVDRRAEENHPTVSQAPPGQQEHYQGQFPHPMFPPWPVHSPPGTIPVYQAFPMQGVPFYQNYPGNGAFYPPPYPTVEENRVGVGHRTRQKRHSLDSRDSNTESDVELEKEGSHSQERRKKPGRSSKKQPGVVVIRNINYISPKKNSSASESESNSSSEAEKEAGESETCAHKHSSRSRKEGKLANLDELSSSSKKDTIYGKEPDIGHWQAFQNCLLRDNDDDNRAASQGIFVEKDGQMRRKHSVGDDPFARGRQDPVDIANERIADLHSVSGDVSRMPRASNDQLLTSREEAHLSGTKYDVEFMEVNGRKATYRRTVNDDFMIGGRENGIDFASSSSPLTVNRFERATSNVDRSFSHDMVDESFIVPLRSMSLYQVGSDDRDIVDMDSELPSALRTPENKSNGIRSQVNYEPDDLSLLPERGTENVPTGYDPALDYELQIHVNDATLHDGNNEVIPEVKQGSNKTDKERRSKVAADDRKKTVGPIRKGKPTKMSPLEDARARAEKLRSYKADLQKMKKEKEEEDMKRLEALKMQRQKRIAARGSSTAAQSSLPSPQTRKQMPTKLSPSSHKGSKFSDSEPGLSSPLQRSKIRTTSLGSSDSQKASKATKQSTDNHIAGNRLTRSVSSLSEPKKESGGVTPDAKVSMARIKRLSEPKTISSHHVASVKSLSSAPASKPRVSNGPESKKISAIVNLDKSKAAALPELKIRTSKRALDVENNKSAEKQITERANTSKNSITSETELNRNNAKIAHQSNVDDSPVVEKTVLMLECDKPSVVAVDTPEENMGRGKEYYDNHDVGKKIEVVSEHVSICAPASPIDAIDVEAVEGRLLTQPSYKVVTDYEEKEPLKFPGTSVADKPYHAPHARLSSLEDVCTENSEYRQALPTSVDNVTTNAETVGLHVTSSGNVKLEKTPEVAEKPHVKESSKGFRRLLKFGKKNNNSGDRNVGSDNASVNGSEGEDSAPNTASSSEVFTLKNLISRDDTPSAGSTLKSSRHFSLLSPFRAKKQTT